MTVSRRLAPALLAGFVTALSLFTLTAAPASAALPGYVRLAHLSPDTPKVDVWVTSFRGGSYSKVLPGVSYGALSDYTRLAPGAYTIAMRKPGANKNSPPLLRTNVTVASGQAYTVAGVGRNADISLKVLNDDLSRPASGMARMRVVQASSVADVVDVTTTTGTSIAQDVRFPSTTKYAEVAAQKWTLEVKPRESGIEKAQQTVQVKSGAIYTVLVLDQGASAVQMAVRADAAGSVSVPAGSVDTGLGGMASANQTGWTRAVLPAALALAAVLGGAVWSRRRVRAC